MDYLTNYYKNLCEQLTARINGIEQQLNELYILDPRQKFASSAKMGMAQDTASMRRGQATRRADILGQMHALASYEGANADEIAAIQRIIADTQQSQPASDDYRYGNYVSYPPSPRQSGTAASRGDVRTALKAIRSRASDPGFASHVTNVISSRLTPTVIDRAETEDSYGEYPMFGSRERARLTAVSNRSAANLTPSTVPSQITTQFGERMFQAFPSDKKYMGDSEYSQYVPAHIVSDMVRGRRSGR
jgi:hypothetical protein